MEEVGGEVILEEGCSGCRGGGHLCDWIGERTDLVE